MVPRVLRFTAGILLIPLCVAVSLTVAGLLQSVQPESAGTVPPAVWALGGGFLAWLFLYFVLPRPVRTYILAHELTHALWGSLMGAKVFGMKISRERGSVTLSKTNFLVTLAPYFFPLYTVVIILGYYILAIFFEVERYHLWWLALVGLTWGFHLTFTISTLAQHQTDIRECGYVFSYATIYLLNAVGIAFWIVLVSAATIEQMVGLLKTDTLAVMGHIAGLFVRIAGEFRQ